MSWIDPNPDGLEWHPKRESSQPTERYLVYGLVDPRTDELRYIGSTESPELRRFEHLVSRIHTITERTKLGAWRRQLAKEGLEPKFVEMRWCEDAASMLAEEEFWICYHRVEMGTDLLNVLGGGLVAVRAVGVAEMNGYIIHDGERWRTETVLRKNSIKLANAEELLSVVAIDCQPDKDEFFERNGGRYLNIYVPSRIVPREGEHPIIDRLLSFLCDGDEEAVRYLTHWIARKVQEPARRTMTSLVLQGKQGTGKDFLANVVMEMIGIGNCARIGQTALESRFNASYAEQLLVVADEIVNRKSLYDTSSILKQLITDDPIMVEQKFAPARMVRNRVGVIFTSNDTVPVRVEGTDDRRYSVFRNLTPATPEHKAMLSSCFNKNSFTEEFLQGEIAAFMYDLRELEVDDELLKNPYDNPARRDLITAGQNSVEAFCERLKELGPERTVKKNCNADIASRCNQRTDALLKENMVPTELLYSVYQQFCKDSGREPYNASKFGVELKRAIPSMERRKLQGDRRAEGDPRQDKNDRVYAYCGFPAAEPVDPFPSDARGLSKQELIDWGKWWMKQNPDRSSRVSVAVELEFGKRLSTKCFQDPPEKKGGSIYNSEDPDEQVHRNYDRAEEKLAKAEQRFEKVELEFQSVGERLKDAQFEFESTTRKLDEFKEMEEKRNAALAAHMKSSAESSKDPEYGPFEKGSIDAAFLYEEDGSEVQRVGADDAQALSPLDSSEDLTKK